MSDTQPQQDAATPGPFTVPVSTASQSPVAPHFSTSTSGMTMETIPHAITADPRQALLTQPAPASPAIVPPNPPMSGKPDGSHSTSPLMIITVLLILSVSGWGVAYTYFHVSSRAKQPAKSQLVPTPGQTGDQIDSALPVSYSQTPYENPFIVTSEKPANPFGSYQNPFSAVATDKSGEPYQNPFGKFIQNQGGI